MSAINEGDYRPSRVRTALSRGRRHIKRRIAPHLFKETYAARHLAARSESVYLEIGVRFGDSFHAMKADKKIAVDPVRTDAMLDLGQRDEFFQCDSDTFFEEHASRLLAATLIDVALVDGLHTFEQAYRDVWNLRRFMSPDGLILLDDCNPPTAERASETPIDGLWNGSVWKVLPLLKPHINASHLHTIDADQGIGIIRDFSGEWPEPMGEEFMAVDAMTYHDLEEDRSGILRLREPVRRPS